MYYNMSDRVRIETNKQAVISSNWLDPHYRNPLFRTPQTVFLLAGQQLDASDRSMPSVRNAEYNYSDRIRHWDWDKAEAAWEQAKSDGFPENSAAFIEAYLRVFFEKPHLELVHIIAGVNLGNGFPYQVFGYFVEPK